MLQEIEIVANLDAVVVYGHGLRPLFALCEAAHSMVSVDTGPAHVAGALSLPLAVLYGAESPKYWLPRTPAGSPVLGVGGPPGANRAEQVPVDALFDAWLAVVEPELKNPGRLESSRGRGSPVRTVPDSRPAARPNSRAG